MSISHADPRLIWGAGHVKRNVETWEKKIERVVEMFEGCVQKHFKGCGGELDL